MRLLAEGLSNEAIAREMTLSVKSVENYVGLIYKKKVLMHNDHTISRRVTLARMQWELDAEGVKYIDAKIAAVITELELLRERLKWTVNNPEGQW